MTLSEPGPVQQPTRPRRRWLRFSLRTMLLLVTVLCVWLGVKVNQARRQKEAVDGLRDLGAIIYYAHQRTDTNPRVFSVEKDLNLPGWLSDLTGDDFFQSVVLVQFMRPVTDDNLIFLDALPEIEKLSFVYGPTRSNPVTDAGKSVTDAGLAHLPRPDRLVRFSGNNLPIGDEFIERLSNSTRLETLVLGNTELTERGLAALHNLARLKVLSIEDPQLGDAALNSLPSMPSIGLLSLNRWCITDEGLAHLARHKSLAKVSLSNTAISDTGLTHLAALPKLRWLDLEGTRVRGLGLAHIAPIVQDWLSLKNTTINDESLMYLKGAKELQYLSLEGTAITDAGLVHLHGLPKLTSINLEGTKVTDKGIVALTKANPRIFIRHRK